MTDGWFSSSASRKETILAELRTDQSVYLEAPVKETEEDGEESKIYHTFVAGFNVEEYTDEIAKLLQEYPELRQVMDELGKSTTSLTLAWNYIDWLYLIL